MKKKIKDIAEIKIGYQFRGRVETVTSGTHSLIQIKDFDESQKLQIDNLSKVNIQSDAERYLIKKEDVLFLARGQRNYAIPIKDDLKNTMAASYFFVLRLITRDILPEYLAWYIKQAPAQEYLHNIARRGTHMPVVPKSSFENMIIDVPSLEIQQRIVKLDSLLEKERHLQNKLIEKRNMLVNAVCLNAIKNKPNKQE
ncbi:MAG: restriction endonuclease subunit S [Smithella sp.]|nr:restriction endonuclease subunit S [Smithella sp.]